MNFLCTNAYDGKPRVFVLVAIAILPLISETIYAPSLPVIAKNLITSERLVEFTITMYLIGMSIGILFWGWLSDRLGRKPGVLTGFALYMVGSLVCYGGETIYTLIFGRLIQGFGGSVGSVLGQAIARDAFRGHERGEVFSTVGVAIALSPTFGPSLGGILATHVHWRMIFLILFALALFVFIICAFQLTETLPAKDRGKANFLQTGRKMLRDYRILNYGLWVGLSNGLSLGFLTEGPFYLVKELGVSPTNYGLSFVIVGAGAAFGGYLSRRYQKLLSSFQLFQKGALVIFAGTILFLLQGVGLFFGFLPKIILPYVVFANITLISFGRGLSIPNALSLALENYQNTTGTASSFFGLFYYVVMVLCTLAMAIFHTGSLLVMPFYFFIVGSIAFWIAIQLRSLENS